MTSLTIHGVPGTLKFVEKGYSESMMGRPGTTNIPGTWHQQVWTSEPRKFKGNELIVCEIRFDDQCRNKHNSFSVTGHTYIPGRRDWETGGCIHDSIEKFFPELAHLIRWHLVDTDQPMHYVANTVYHASNLHNGKAKGEPNRWETRLRFGTFPITFAVKPLFLVWLLEVIEHRKTTAKTNPHRRQFEVVAVPYVNRPGSNNDFGPHYSFDDFTGSWYDAPFTTQAEALEWQTALLVSELKVLKVVTGYSPGKERNLEAARRCAVWPDATDEQLCLPPAELTALLEARLPPLLNEFQADVEAAGLKWGGRAEEVTHA